MTGFWHGLTAAERQKLGYACDICARTRKRDGKSLQLNVDHDHRTGLIRGILCTRCNDLLGYVHEDAELLARAAGYATQGGPARLKLGGPRYVPGSPGAEGKLT